MGNIKLVSQDTNISVVSNEEGRIKTKEHQNFIDVLSEIIEKYGADTLKDLECVV